MVEPSFAVRPESSDLIGPSPALAQVRRAIREYGPTDLPVLVTGETGTGKELVANGLHRASPRSPRPFVSTNCAALSPTLFESEFFGSHRGSFTGADRDREGLIGAAEGGTLFLDEIGELPLEAQAKLLRLLESGCYRPVGASRELKADVRILAATNRDLVDAVAQRSFRSDLYYRLDVLHVHIPPLRERAEDVLPLVFHLLAMSGVAPREITPEARLQLEGWPWPGNVRELGHVVSRTLVRQRSGPITAFCLERVGDEREAGPMRRVTARAATRREYREQQRERILAHLNEQHWNVSAAARALGWSRGALRSRMRRLGL